MTKFATRKLTGWFI